MLGNFKKLFIDNPSANVNLPFGILEALNYNLPEGFSYTDIGNGFCRLMIPNGTQIKGRLRLEGASLENLQKCNTFNDLVRYAINIQKPIQLLPSEDGFYYLNDNPFTYEQFIKSPLKDIELENGVIQYIPPEFNHELKLLISAEGKENLVILKRVPFDSLNQLKFVSKEDTGFVISVFVSVESPIMKISVTTDFSNAGSVQNVCNSIFWFNAFAQGKLKIFGELVNENNEANLTPYDDDTIAFWKQLYDIEKIVKVSFDVSNGVYDRDVINVRELYRSIVEKKPFRKDETITCLSAFDESKSIDEMKEYIGKELFKSFYYEDESRKYCLELEPTSNIVPYTATQYFITKNELDIFLKNENSYNELFEKATYIPVAEEA